MPGMTMRSYLIRFFREHSRGDYHSISLYVKNNYDSQGFSYPHTTEERRNFSKMLLKYVGIFIEVGLLVLEEIPRDNNKSPKYMYRRSVIFEGRNAELESSEFFKCVNCHEEKNIPYLWKDEGTIICEPCGKAMERATCFDIDVANSLLLTVNTDEIH